MKKYFCLFLSALLLLTAPLTAEEPVKPLTVSDLQKKYPNAKIQEVSVSEYDCMKSKAMRQGTVGTGAPIEAQGYYRDDGVFITPHMRGGYYNDGSWFSIFPGSGGSPGARPSSSGSNNGGKDLLIVVAVIGAVVVAALAVYAAAYLVQAASEGLDCKAWNEIGFRWSNIQDGSNRQTRSGSMTGLFGTFNYFVPFGALGITVEAGHHDLELAVNQGAGMPEIFNRYQGAYAMFGPTITIPFTNNYSSAFQIELLGGTSSRADIGLVSTIRLGVLFDIGKVGFGIHLGGALTDVKGFDGYLTNSDHLNFLTGFAASYRF